MRIEIWSDIVCPWCYIGKRRFEAGLAAFLEHHPEAEVETHWRSFQLDPGAPEVATDTIAEHLGKKYGGGPAAGQQMVDRMEAAAAEEGLLYRLSQAQRSNTVDAHRLLHLAADQGCQDELKEALLAAYFLHTENVADHGVLTRLAHEVGLDEQRTREVLASDEYADAIEADIRQAAAYGATGVPFFVIDGRYGVAGAQPAELFTQTLERAWADSRPELSMVGAGVQTTADEHGHGDACGPEGCAV
ncbi:DsbA family oxidoreductase [Nocardioides sp.]|uniref:DsbA family oxidoreductase n=1 Tax=Nocardioides sp. TaxID=35761 RepID=UPI0035642AE0